MLINRNEFRHVIINNKSFLYPFPVIKEKKYLIIVNPQFATFFIECFLKGYLLSPDKKNSFYINESVHSDGKTPILKFNFNKLHFNLLQNEKSAPDKAQTINKLLNQKIIAVLRDEKDAINKLEKTIENQKKCHVCQSLKPDYPVIEHLLNISNV